MELKLVNTTKCGIISPEDYDNVIKFNWHIDNEGYIVNNKKIRLHRFIMEPENNLVVDHKNGNRLDNRRENLIITSNLKNLQNKKVSKSKIYSKYKGVYFYKKTGKYEASITLNFKKNLLGYFKNEIEAAEAYDMYVIHNNLDHIMINFPEKKSIYSNKMYVPYIKRRTIKTKYFGIRKSYNKFIPFIKIDGKIKYLGSKNSEIEAAEYYDDYVYKNNIPNMKLNFPEKFGLQKLDYNTIKNEHKIIDDLTIELILDSGVNVIIDKKDYEKIKYFRCFVGAKGYIYFNMNNKSIRLHRFLMEVTDPLIFIDHIDGNKLNNTRKNLRFSDAQKNSRNRLKSKQKNFSSKYMGVHFNKVRNLWKAQIKRKGKNIYDISDKNELHAAIQRDLYILDHLKEDHYKLNFEWNKEKIIEWKNKLEVK